MRKAAMILIAALTVFLQKAKADWPIGKGRTTLLPGYTYFYSASNYNRSWKRAAFPNGNYFQTHVTNLSLNHGLGRSLDLLVNVPYIIQRGVNKDSVRGNSGFGDVSVGIAKHFSSSDQHRHFTAKALFMMPMYQKDSAVSLGYSSRAYSLEVNYSFAAGKAAFAIAQAAYTHFFDNPEGPKQYTYTATYGRKFNMFSLATISFMHQESVSSNTGFNPNLFANTSFTSGRLTLSYGRRITRTIMPMFQVSSVVYGKNAGGGFGLGVSFITRLP